MREIQALGRSMKMAVNLRIIGQTDPTGTRDYNLDLSRRRAQTVRNILIRQGIDAMGLDAIGAGTAKTADSGRDEGDAQAYRSVRFAPYMVSQ